MKEGREFPSPVIASLSSGILLCEFGAMHEAAEYLMGHPIWTHHFADKSLLAAIRKAIDEQCPGMPTSFPDMPPAKWRDKAAEIEAQFGKLVTIRKGSGATAMEPLDGIPDHLKDKTIIVGK
jgi:hypothetical protein